MSHVPVSCLTDAPRVRLTPAGPLRVRMGEAVSVDCHATGRPRPTLKWKRQGSTLQLVTSEINDVNTIHVKNNVNTIHVVLAFFLRILIENYY